MHGDHSQCGALPLLREVYALLLSQESCCIWKVHRKKAYIPYNLYYYMYVSYLSYSATNTCIRKNEMHMVFWIVTPLSLVRWYQFFGWTLVCHTRLLSSHEEMMGQVVGSNVQPSPFCCSLKNTLRISVPWAMKRAAQKPYQYLQLA